jgi:hypothetical protein
MSRFGLIEDEIARLTISDSGSTTVDLQSSNSAALSSTSTDSERAKEEMAPSINARPGNGPQLSSHSKSTSGQIDKITTNVTRTPVPHAHLARK